MTRVAIAHWNDVYRVTPQKVPSTNETIDVTQFAGLLDDLRARWQEAGLEPLSLFSGDVFSPSVESSVTRGSHMVPVLNTLAPDVSLTGNHDFDFGYPHLTKLITDTSFPWLLSNIVDNETGSVPASLLEYVVLKRQGLSIGVIGLVEKEWIGTVSSWPQNFEYRDMAETGLRLSQLLRDPEGEHKCDLIIALTHCRVPNDITLGKALYAASPARATEHVNRHGVDLLLGGHDHLYYVSRGVSAWEGHDPSTPVLGAEHDEGDILLVKSGTDFRDLSEIMLELESTPAGSVRKHVIKKITGKHLTTQSDHRSHEGLKKILEDQLSAVKDTLRAPICKLAARLDVRSEYIRVAESAAGDWFADILRHSYDDALCIDGCGGSDGVLICAGTLRGDSVYDDTFTLGNLMEVLPFEDPIVVLELDGSSLWEALESSLSTWPAQEGRFPVISGFRVSWDSTKPPNERVQSVSLSEDGDIVERKKGGRMYKVVTRDYMAQGHDGFEALKDNKYLIDDESGQMMSTLVRRYLMGCHYVNTMVRVTGKGEHVDKFEHLHHQTRTIIQTERENQRIRAAQGDDESHQRAISNWHRAFRTVRDVQKHIAGHLAITSREHMSDIDVYQGADARRGCPTGMKGNEGSSDDLLVAHPLIDGRLQDVSGK